MLFLNGNESTPRELDALIKAGLLEDVDLGSVLLDIHKSAPELLGTTCDSIIKGREYGISDASTLLMIKEILEKKVSE